MPKSNGFFFFGFGRSLLCLKLSTNKNLQPFEQNPIHSEGGWLECRPGSFHFRVVRKGGWKDYLSCSFSGVCLTERRKRYIYIYIMVKRRLKRLRTSASYTSKLFLLSLHIKLCGCDIRYIHRMMEGYFMRKEIRV